MKKTALIPARYDSSRFPGKLMKALGGKTVIRTTYEATLNSGLFDDVFVVTDSELIFEEIISNGGTAIMSKKPHVCGTDRIAEAVISLPESEIIVNVQGDEPFIPVDGLSQVIKAFEQDKSLRVASLMHLMSEEEAADPNNVKVVVDNQSMALLFSRSVIPYKRVADVEPTYYKHVGIYAFRRAMLLEFPHLEQGPLEKAESLEGLRYLEHGIKMKMILTETRGVGIDTPNDLHKAQQLLNYKT